MTQLSKNNDLHSLFSIAIVCKLNNLIIFFYFNKKKINIKFKNKNLISLFVIKFKIFI